jgi:hypothetical protein
VEAHVEEYGNAVRPQMLIQQTITKDRADKTKQENGKMKSLVGWW